MKRIAFIFLFVAGIAVAAPKTTEECLNLLHANFRVIKLGFKKAVPPADDSGPANFVTLAAGKNMDQLYGTDSATFGVIDGKTGRVKPIYEAKSGTLGGLTSTEKHVSVSVYAKKGGLVGQIFANRTTGATQNLKLPTKAVVDGHWQKSGMEVFPYAAGDRLHLFDIETGKSRKLGLPFVPTQVSLLGNANAVVVYAGGRPPLIIDLATGEKISIPGLEKVRIAKTARGGYHFRAQTPSRFYVGHASEGVLEVDVAARTTTRLESPIADADLSQVLADGDYLVYQRKMPQPPSGATAEELTEWNRTNRVGFFNRSSLVERKTGKTILKNTYFDVTEGPAGKGFLVGNRKMRPMPGEDNAYMSDGTNLFLWSPRSRELMKIADAKEVNFAETVYNPYNDTWMSSIYPNYRPPTPPKNGNAAPPDPSAWQQYLQVFDAEGKRIQRLNDFDHSFARDQQNRFLGFYSGQFQGGKELLRIALPDFATAAKSPVEGWGKAAKFLATPMPASEAKTHYPYLMAFFESGAYRKYPKQTTGAFLNLFSVSNGYSADLLVRHVDLEALLVKHPLDLKTMTAAEQRSWKATAANYLKLLQLGDTFRDGHIAHIRAIAPFLKDFSPAKSEELLDTIAEAAKNRVMSEIGDLRDVFSSKVYKVIRRSIAEDFNIKESPITDATAVQDADGLKLLALGSSEIEGGTRTRFGLEYKKLFQMEIPKNARKNQVLVEKKFAWKHRGQRYSADFVAKTTDKTLDDIVEFTQGPNYPAHWKDGKFTTMVITGSNLFDDAKTTLDEYLQYFLDRGYVFDEKIDHLGDVLSYMKQEVEGGHVDMLVKEAHSDGDEKNLFRIFKTSDLMIGRRKLKDGREEVVHLVYPDKSAGNGENDAMTKLISNDEFGAWIRARDKTATPILYLNVSCSSYTKAANEIQAALSKTLVVVASKNLMDTFTNETDAAMYHLINSTLEGHTYSQTNKAMQIDPENKAGAGNNVVFPDAADPEPYKETVLKGIRIPLNTRVQVYDPHGKPVDIDAHGH